MISARCSGTRMVRISDFRAEVIAVKKQKFDLENARRRKNEPAWLRILHLLSANSEMTGGDVKAALPSLPRGTIYPVLQMLEDDGLATSRVETEAERDPRQSGPPRRFYRVVARASVALYGLSTVPSDRRKSK